MEGHAHVPRMGSSWGHWLVEGLLIFVSVGLAFLVADYREYRADRALAAQVLERLGHEVETNLATLEPYVPFHREWLKALGSAANAAPDGKTGLEVSFATRPTLPPAAQSPYPLLRRSAWDAALSGDTLRHLDFETAESLSEVYRLQEIVTGNIQRLATGPLSQVTTFDPASETASVRMLWLTMADIESAEEGLLTLYRQRLPLIAGRSDGPKK